MKISTLLISIILLSAISGIFLGFYTGITTTYTNVTLDANQTVFLNGTQDKMENIVNLSKEINTTVRELDLSKPIQFAAAFVGAGFKVLELTYSGADVALDVVSDSVDQAVPGDSAGIVKVSLITIMLILFMFIIISVLIGGKI